MEPYIFPFVNKQEKNGTKMDRNLPNVIDFGPQPPEKGRSDLTQMIGFHKWLHKWRNGYRNLPKSIDQRFGSWSGVMF